MKECAHVAIPAPRSFKVKPANFCVFFFVYGVRSQSHQTTEVHRQRVYILTSNLLPFPLKYSFVFFWWWIAPIINVVIIT